MYDFFQWSEIEPEIQVNESVAVHLHLFYEDLKQEFFDYFSNIPFGYDLYISCREGADAEGLRNFFAGLKNANSVTVRATPNRGRDIAPLYVLFGKEIQAHDFFLHVHSKKSLYTGTEQVSWRTKSLDMLTGSAVTVEKIFRFFKEKHAGLVYPEAFNFFAPIVNSWLANKAEGIRLLEKLGLKDDEGSFFSYPAGSFFWARTDAVRKLFELNFSYEDFPPECGQTDGTLAHTLERVIAFASRGAGYNNFIIDKDADKVCMNESEYTYRSVYDLNKRALIRQLKQYRVVSFDVFDTLITRKLLIPDDIFLWLEERTGIKDYLKIRKRAEALANEKYGAATDIVKIYAEFPALLQITRAEADRLMQEEIACEKRVCIARRDMVDVVRALAEGGVRIILVSDMYLSGAVITDILAQCGFQRDWWSDVFVSCECGLRKDTGTIWEAVGGKYDLFGFNAFIHLGDNPRSDAQIPGDRGMANVYVPSGLTMAKMHRSYASLRNFFAERSLKDSFLLGLTVNACLFNSPFALQKDGTVYVSSDMVGYSFFGPVLAAFCEYIAQKARGNLLFLAREGKLLQEYYKKFCEKSGVAERPNRYLYTSRRACGVASIGTREALYDYFASAVGSYEGTARHLFRTRLSIDIEEDENISLPKDIERVKALCDRYYDRIMHSVREESEAYGKYLRSVIKDDEAYQVVDLGYSGSIQTYLAQFLHRKLDGLYLVCSKDPKPLKIGCECESLYTFRDSWEQTIFLRNSLMLESMLKIECGQLDHFEREGESVVPVFKKADVITESEKKIQRSAGLFVEEFASLIRGVGGALNPSLLENNFDNLFRRDVRFNVPSLNKLFVEDDYTSVCRYLQYNRHIGAWVRSGKVRRYSLTLVLVTGGPPCFAEKCLKGIASDGFGDHELIVAVPQEYGQAWQDRMSAYRPPDGGCVKLLFFKEEEERAQRCLAEAEGQYICFLHETDVLLQGSMKDAVVRAERDLCDMVVWTCAKSTEPKSEPFRREEKDGGILLNGDTGVLYLISVDFLEKNQIRLEKTAPSRVVFPFEYIFRQERRNADSALFLAEPIDTGFAHSIGVRHEIGRMAERIGFLEGELDRVYRSRTYRAGRLVTWAPRKARNFMRMLRTKGIRYTLVRLFGGRKRAAEYEKTKIPYRK